MNEVYAYLQYSKQAFHQKMNRYLGMMEQSLLLLPLIEELRHEHPGVGIRQLYRILQPEHMGRDRFESFCFEHGYKLDRPKAYKRTTDSTGVIRFSNLVTGRELNSVNQVWSSDITYYEINGSFYYLTFIIDLFSRKIGGFAVSKRLLTEQTTIPALLMALQKCKPPEGLIFHSDGGGQYYCKEFLSVTKDYKILNSMCESVYENPHAERINGTIKNQYLKGYNPQSFGELLKATKRAVNNYNNVRPHQSLGNLSPVMFEETLPAGGPLLTNDVFCNIRNPSELQQKKHHLPTRLKNNSNLTKVYKTTQKRSTLFRH